MYIYVHVYTRECGVTFAVGVAWDVAELRHVHLHAVVSWHRMLEILLQFRLELSQCLE